MTDLTPEAKKTIEKECSDWYDTLKSIKTQDDANTLSINVSDALLAKIAHMEARLSFLEENSFSDRAVIGLLVNKIESLIK